MSPKQIRTDQRSRPLVHFQQQAQVRRRPVTLVWRHPFTGYLFTVPFVGTILLGILWIQHHISSSYFFSGPLLLAVMLVALIWGVGPALFCTLVSTLALSYLYIPAFKSFNVTNWNVLLPIFKNFNVTSSNVLLPVVPFFISGIIIALVTGQRESARRRARIAEQEEQERAAELEATFEAMADGVVVYDDTGHILRSNAAARQLFMLDVKPRSKLPWRREQRPALVMLDEHGQVLSEEQSPLSRILNGEVLTSANAMDVVLRTPDGHDVQLNVTGAPVYKFGGGPMGAICVFRDVTERRQLERRTHDALHALLKMAETLVQAPDDTKSVREHSSTAEETYTSAAVTEVARRLAELTCNVLGCHRVSIITVDPETEALHLVAVVGFSPEQEGQWWAEQQWQGRLSDSPYPELISRLRANEAQVLDMLQPPLHDQPNPYGIRTMLVAPMFVGEQLVGILWLDYGDVAHEFTGDEKALAGAIAKLAALVIERERLLQERAQARANELALREANRRMDEFLGMAGHELRTPLTTIKGNIQLAKRQLKKSVLEDGTYADDLASKLELIQDFLDRAERHVQLQNRLVRDLLDVSRIRADKLELNLEHCDLRAIVRDTVLDQCQLVPTRTIEMLLPPEASVPVMADAERISQVVTNYLTNALKYSAVDRPVEASLEVEGQVARVSVRDEGPGLFPAEQEAIWERFYQVERVKVQSGSSGGLGLGLHICRTIIERHGGQVGIESVPGTGSTFWFTLPLARD